jgi:hypothetical protein
LLSGNLSSFLVVNHSLLPLRDEYHMPTMKILVFCLLLFLHLEEHVPGTGIEFDHSRDYTGMHVALYTWLSSLSLTLNKFASRNPAAHLETLLEGDGCLAWRMREGSAGERMRASKRESSHRTRNVLNTGY